MYFDKPAYTEEVIRSIDRQDMIGRLRIIDNELAWRIAAELYLAAIESCKFPVPNNEVSQLRTDLRESLKDGRTIHCRITQAGPDKYTSRLLLGNLNKLRSARLAEFVTGDPAALIEKFYTGRPLLRLILPTVRLRDSTEIATFLVGNIELLKNPRRGQPFIIIQVSNFLMNVVTITPILWLMNAVIPSIYFNMSWIDALMSAIVASAIQWILPISRNRDRANNALALYISFTDEFIDDEDAA